jgi:hypothetical protein
MELLQKASHTTEVMEREKEKNKQKEREGVPGAMIFPLSCRQDPAVCR